MKRKQKKDKREKKDNRFKNGLAIAALAIKLVEFGFKMWDRQEDRSNRKGKGKKKKGKDLVVVSGLEIESQNLKS